MTEVLELIAQIIFVSLFFLMLLYWGFILAFGNHDKLNGNTRWERLLESSFVPRREYAEKCIEESQRKKFLLVWSLLKGGFLTLLVIFIVQAILYRV